MPTTDPSIPTRSGPSLSVVKTDDLLVQLVETLDRDLELLAVLRYRLTVLGALAGADQTPSIPTAVREIELAYEALRLADLARATATLAVAEELAFAQPPRLDELAARVDGVWSEVLLERRGRIIEAVGSVQSLAQIVKASMGQRAAMVEQSLNFLRSEGPSTYGRPTSRSGVLIEGAI